MTSLKKIRAAAQEFSRIWYSSVNVYERTQELRFMNAKMLRQAMKINDVACENGCWFKLQQSVRRALESRLRRLEREAKNK